MLKKIFVDYNPVAFLTTKLLNNIGIVRDLTNYFSQLIFNNKSQNFTKLLFMIGCSAITIGFTKWLYKFYQTWNWVHIHIYNQKQLNAQNLIKKYGKCYACITGFTDGIGFAFCQILAQYGFNLFLISRTKQKVQKRANQLRQRYPNIGIITQVIDLSNQQQVNSLQKVFQLRKDIDIGILINNAGSVQSGSFIKIKPKSLIQDTVVDFNAIITLNRILVPRMRARKDRSAIINISSVTGVYLSAGLGVYSSIKKCLQVYSGVLGKENKDKIDVLSAVPLGVTTKMMKMKKGPFMITPRQCVTSILADVLGGETRSFTHFKHKLSNSHMMNLNQQQIFQLYAKAWEKTNLQAQ